MRSGPSRVAPAGDYPDRDDDRDRDERAQGAEPVEPDDFPHMVNVGDERDRDGQGQE